MAHLYITDNGSILSVDGGRYVVKQKNELVRSIPKESIESISIFGNSSITTPCIQSLLVSKIPVSFFSSKGKYYGRLHGIENEKVEFLKKQLDIFEDEAFCKALSVHMIAAKIHNQLIVLSRYAKATEKHIESELDMMKYLKKKVLHAQSTEEIMGYEGTAAKFYFKALGEIVHPEFKFYGRTKRPPRDPFNSLLSLGYTMLMYEIMAKIETEHMSPYCGILHTVRDGSPALCSDMMEEWRAVITDSVALSMVQGNEIRIDDFITDDDHVGIYLSNAALRKFINKFERKLNVKNRYLGYDEKEYSFRQALHVQCRQMAACIKEKDPYLYQPVRIR